MAVPTPQLLLFLVLLSAYAVIPLAQSGLPASDDGVLHLYRAWQIDRLLREGMLYPRWASDLYYGYGYPLFIFEPPPPYYPIVLLHHLGLGYIDAYKLWSALALILSGLAAYPYARLFLSPPSSLLVSVAYVYIPYHLADLYVRGALRELVAFIWFPLLLWAMHRLGASSRWGYGALVGLTFGGLILTHNVTAFLLSPFLALYALGLALGRGRGSGAGSRFGVWAVLAGEAAGLLLGLALSAFYWLPALALRETVQLSLVMGQVERHLRGWGELVSLLPLFDYGAGRPQGELAGLKLGFLQAILVLVGAGAWLRGWRVGGARVRFEGCFALVILGSGLYLMTPASAWLWKLVPLAEFVEFPWRSLGLMALPSALLAGFLMEGLRPRWQSVALPVLLLLVLLSSGLGLRFPMTLLTEERVSLEGLRDLELSYGSLGLSSIGEYLPVGARQRAGPTGPTFWDGALPSAPLHLEPAASATVVVQERRPGRVSYGVQAEQEVSATFPILLFPGWTALRDDAQALPLEPSDPEGFARVRLPPGKYTVVFRWLTPPLFLLAELISLAAGVGIGLWALGAGIRSPLRRLRWQPWPPVAPGNRRALAMALALAALWLVVWQLYPQLYPGGAFFTAEFAHLVELAAPSFAGRAPVDSAPVLVRGEAALEVELQLRPLVPQIADAESLHLFACLVQGNHPLSCTTAPLAPLLGRGRPRLLLRVPVPEGLVPGAYQIRPGLFSSRTEEALPISRQWALPLILSAEGRLLPPIYVAPFRALGAEPRGEPSSEGELTLLGAASPPFDDPIARALLGLAPRPPGDNQGVAAGQPLTIDLLWQLPEAKGDYRVGGRLVDEAGFTHAYQPPASLVPWEARRLLGSGAVVRQRLQVPIPFETPPGPYSLELEAAFAARRLGLFGGAPGTSPHRLPLGEVRVAPSLVVPGRPEGEDRARPLLPGLELFRSRVSAATVPPGDGLDLDLLWRARETLPWELWARFELRDPQGEVWATATAPLGGKAYPTSRWRPLEVIRGQYRLPIPRHTPAGAMILIAQISAGPDTPALAEVELGPVEVQGRPHRYQPPAMAHPSGALFGSLGTLLGYDLAEPGPGQTGQERRLEVTLWWRAQEPLPERYKVSVQLWDQRGAPVAQHDAEPGGGAIPTTGWLPGEILEDRHTLILGSGVSPGSYRVVVIVYRADSGERLAVRVADPTVPPELDYLMLHQLALGR